MNAPEFIDQTKASEPKPGSKPDAKDDLKSLPLAEVEKKLGSSPDGLTQAEAAKRLTQYGPNKIEEKQTNPFLKFLSYFWGPIPWMIEAAMILSAVAQHWPGFCIILVLLLANAVVGFWEEREAGNAIEALRAKLVIKARVKRDGKWVNPAARELVPGDVIRLRLGDIVPADARLLDGDPVEVDQSALTGESLPATRNPDAAVLSGSIIRRGEIGARVYATGANTYFGKTAQLVQEAHTVSHFPKAVLTNGNYLITLAVVQVAAIIAVANFRGDPILTTLQFALVLTVAAIPVAMPTALSVAMAVGARLLAKKEAIVSGRAIPITGSSAQVSRLKERPAWKALEAHYATIRHVHPRRLFTEDPHRGERLSVEAAASMRQRRFGRMPRRSPMRFTRTLSLRTHGAAVDISGACGSVVPRWSWESPCSESPCLYARCWGILAIADSSSRLAKVC